MLSVLPKQICMYTLLTTLVNFDKQDDDGAVSSCNLSEVTAPQDTRVSAYILDCKKTL